jgi:hypothetical protein
LSSEERQWRTAQEALRFLLEGDITIERQGPRVTISSASATWRPEALERSLAYLNERTGLGRQIDPFERSAGTSWIILSQLLAILGQNLLALDVSLRYLRVCYDLQDQHQRRMHKGGPLFCVSQRYREVGEINLARGFTLLAFVEDCKAYENPREAPAYSQLLSVFRFSPDLLEGLIDFATRQEPFPQFPEEILLEWELSNAPALPKPRTARRGA